MTTKAVILARFSPRPDAKESESNEKQIEKCRAYCAAKGYEVAEDRIFQDDGLSGMDEDRNADPLKAAKKRPGLSAAIHTTRKDFVLVVVWRTRISRDDYTEQGIERVIEMQGGRVEAVEESNEISLGGDLQRGVISTVRKWDVIKIRIATAFCMNRYQNRDGRRMGRLDRCPWGFKPDLDSANNNRGKPGRLIVDPDEAETTRLIMVRHAEGARVGEICRYLDQAGRTRRGKTWAGGRGLVRAIIKRATAARTAK